MENVDCFGKIWRNSQTDRQKLLEISSIDNVEVLHKMVFFLYKMKTLSNVLLVTRK